VGRKEEREEEEEMAKWKGPTESRYKDVVS